MLMDLLNAARSDPDFSAFASPLFRARGAGRWDAKTTSGTAAWTGGSPPHSCLADSG